MIVEELGLPGLLKITLKRFGDDRGWFMETWNQRSFAEKAGVDVGFVQDNHSRSARGVLRGLHYQHLNPQGKLVRVTRGRVWDVAVDIRRSSPGFGQWRAIELSADDPVLFWVPAGFAHGFLALEDDSELQYKCTDFYAPGDEYSLAWNDPTIAIDWPLDGEPLLSGKDVAGTALADARVFA